MENGLLCETAAAAAAAAAANGWWPTLWAMALLAAALAPPLAK